MRPTDEFILQIMRTVRADYADWGLDNCSLCRGGQWVSVQVLGGIPYLFDNESPGVIIHSVDDVNTALDTALDRVNR